MAEAGPSSTSTNPTEEETRADADVIASEVQRVNQILEIENLHWERQLKQAVSVFLLILRLQSGVIPLSLCCFPTRRVFFIQGFRDSSLSVWEVSCVLRNF